MRWIGGQKKYDCFPDYFLPTGCVKCAANKQFRRFLEIFGRIEFVEDQAFALELCRELARRFNPSEADIEKEIRMAGSRVQVLCLIPEHITGKRVHEA